ncbi:CotS family spore coat protein [Clostridium sp. JN-1]|jgi:CotS family spore coat protein|uniref:CotS family spore coat protein n=1 Tax=Clostridium sp. JN-1 TaxID=2483110 RepID=UPI000F0B8488|nr:CotS family spore coat protein [Clostridium sp. JN-1]
MPYSVAKHNNCNLLSEENARKYVLPYYNLEYADIKRVKFKNTDKQRAVYKVTNLDQNYCLKKVYFSKEDLLFVYSAVEWLFRYGIKVPRILATKENSRFVNYSNMLFILTPWIDGDKCNYDNKEQILSSIYNLSLIHNICKNFTPIEGSFIRKNFNDIYSSIKKHFEQLLNCSNLAFNYKDKFSKEFLQHFDINLTLAKISLTTAASICNDNLSISLCHLDYVNKNIIFGTDGNIWTIDFDKCSLDYCTHDISYFLRRLLRRDATNWNTDLTIECLELYEKVHPLNFNEYKYILSYLSFPQKFWKLSRDYYNNIKKCNHNSFFYLLKKAVENDVDQLNFSLKFSKYIENKFNIEIT